MNGLQLLLSKKVMYASHPMEDSILAKIMTTKELSQYLKLHPITICKYASRGDIPAVRIGRNWRFNKEAIDDWISGGQKERKA